MTKNKGKGGYAIKMDIEKEYEGKVVLVTGGAKLFYYKETFTKERKLNTEVKR